MQMGMWKENLASSEVDLCRELTEHAYEDLDRDEEQHQPLEGILPENVEINFVPIPEVESEYEDSGPWPETKKGIILPPAYSSIPGRPAKEGK
ncbi:uncharacterized protein A4U43_C07F5360 [Asparagus officinalis]|uniref:Uncharacterized protein n=1 Tax=Asparagus officinalis TaxID=4686 RepID=A0A5P1EET3_ASPOF|nr:uncharacterized protein A4U43_C07F5360 [Asparagus officinalis]